MTMYAEYPKKIRQALMAYGFDEKETSVYLAGLEAGSATVLDLARRANLPRTTLYPILEQFCRRGFFHARIVKGRKQYVAEPPATFLRKLEDKQKTFRDILPDLQKLCSTGGETAGVTMFEGSDGFRQFWHRLFESGVKEYCLLTSASGLRAYAHEEYLVSHMIAMRLKLGIRSRQLLPENAMTRKVVATDREQLRESRYLPENASLPATVLIFGSEAAFITTRKENSIILVESGDVAATLRTAFELVWSGAKKAE